MSCTVMPLVPLKSALGLAANQAARKSKMSCTVIAPLPLKSARQVGVAQ